MGNKNDPRTGVSKDRSFETNREFKWDAPPSWKGLDDYANFDLGDQLLEPQLDHQFADTSRSLKESYGSPYGSEMGAEERTQGYRDSLERLNESRGVALEQAGFNRKRLELQRKGDIAGMTRPQLITPKEYGYGEKKDSGSGGFWGNLVGGVAGGLLGSLKKAGPAAGIGLI
ncbi:MAG: hypothetical protein HOP19_21495 [Acidobacteria bacterium]|nr:hypothetical protein [Acidobacteriota bacterium]